MAKVIYTAHAHVTGGRAGHGHTTDNQLDVELRVPTEMGGPGGGTNPEELFAVGYAACFESALMNVARRQKLDADDVTIDSSVGLLPNGEGGFKLAVSLDVTIGSLADAVVATQLIKDAHQVCPYSNAVKGNVEVELLLAGTPL